MDRLYHPWGVVEKIGFHLFVASNLHGMFFEVNPLPQPWMGQGYGSPVWERVLHPNTTSLRGVDSPAKVLQALQCLFPTPSDPNWKRNQRWANPSMRMGVQGCLLGAFLQQLHEQRILDTALDAMSMNIDGTAPPFTITPSSRCRKGGVSHPRR